jgi:hypothetical protein
MKVVDKQVASATMLDACMSTDERSMLKLSEDRQTFVTT